MKMENGKKRKRLAGPGGWMLAAMMLLTTAAFPQVGGSIFDKPELRKFFNPVVGHGALYESTGKGAAAKKQTLEFAVVGRETIEGKEFYWIEAAIEIPNLNGKSYTKVLSVPGESNPRRSIVQYPGMDAMEMPLHPNPRSRSKAEESNLRKIGTETITVPAGTFECEHWQNSDSNVWISSKVSPLPIVKVVSKSDSMVLVKIVDNAKDHITGPIRPYDAKAFVRHMMELQGKN